MERYFSFFVVCFFFVGPGVAQEEDFVRFLEPITIEPGQSARDAVCLLCPIEVDGSLSGDAVAVLGRVEISGTVQGDVVSVGNNVVLKPEGKVGGDCVAAGGRIESGQRAQVGGEMVSTIPLAWLTIMGLLILWLGFTLVLTLAVGIVLVIRR